MTRSKAPAPIYAQGYQFREVLFRMAPNWVRTYPEGKFAVHLIAQAFSDNAAWFFSPTCERFVLLCDNLGLSHESVAKLYRQTSPRYNASIGMRYM